MVRARLATLTLAGSLLLTSSGCFNLFERFQSWRHGADCTCNDLNGPHGATVPTSVEAPESGPILVAPAPIFTPPPPTGTPIGPPPRIVPVPAQPMPWSGQQ